MIEANIWDATFRHEGHSVLGKTPERIRYYWGATSWNGTTLFVDGCASPGTVRQVQSNRKVGWLHEPPCLHPQDYENVDWDGLDMVLTYHEPLLSHPKAQFVPYGGVWIPRADWGMHPKTKLCSMLIGTKTATEGHRIRHAIARELRGLDVDFYGAGAGVDVGYGPQAKLRVLKDYAFSIVTETCWEENLFTEWLCDCLAVGTVPVLWGCPNVGDFFDAAGILRFETPGGARMIARGLTLGLYEAMRPYAECNLGTVRRYEITDDLVAEAIA